MFISLSPVTSLVQLLLLWSSDPHGTKSLTSPVFGRELGSISVFPLDGNIIIFSIWDVREQVEKEKEISAKNTCPGS